MKDIKKNKLNLVLCTDDNPILREKAIDVKEVTDELLSILDTMTEIMHKSKGLGLAGPQVSLSKRIVVIDAEVIAAEDKNPIPKERYLKLINPKIISCSKEVCIMEEGCLSVPTIYADIERPKTITITYTNTLGENIELQAEELLARCIEHELDHLEGKLFIDYLSPFKRKLIMSKVKKLKLD